METGEKGEAGKLSKEKLKKFSKREQRQPMAFSDVLKVKNGPESLTAEKLAWKLFKLSMPKQI